MPCSFKALSQWAGQRIRTRSCISTHNPIDLSYRTADLAQHIPNICHFSFSNVSGINNTEYADRTSSLQPGLHDSPITNVNFTVKRLFIKNEARRWKKDVHWPTEMNYHQQQRREEFNLFAPEFYI
jgi:hypothetical protein